MTASANGYFLSQKDFAIPRAQSINCCDNGLSVRFLRVMSWNSRRVIGSSTGNFLIERYLRGLVMMLAATTARKGPVAARLIRKFMA